MPSMTLIKHDELTTARLNAAGQRPGADRGDPQMAIQALAADASGSLGIWECQPGSWPVVERPDTEFTYILSGRALITDADTGQAREITAGDLVILPPGWSGRWEIVETVRKVYAIY